MPNLFLPTTKCLDEIGYSSLAPPACHRRQKQHLGNRREQLPLIDRRVVRRCPWRRFWRPIQRRHISERHAVAGDLKLKVKFHYPPIRDCLGSLSSLVWRMEQAFSFVCVYVHCMKTDRNSCPIHPFILLISLPLREINSGLRAPFLPSLSGEEEEG